MTVKYGRYAQTFEHIDKRKYILEMRHVVDDDFFIRKQRCDCLLYTSDAADERSSVDLGGRRIIKHKPPPPPPPLPEACPTWLPRL